MADITIPGVSDTYKTNELIKALVEEAKIPLNREKENLETYQSQEDCWRTINTNMAKVEESAKTLYSFDNPFNSRKTTSSNENAITVESERNADIGTYKIDVKNVATADRFLSREIDDDTEVPKGKYTFSVNDKKVSFDWKGGKIESFVTALNRRSSDIIKARLIGVTKDSKSLLIESLVSGAQNHLAFEDDALQFALDNDIIKPAKNEENTFFIQKNELQNTGNLIANSVNVSTESIVLPPQSGFEVKIPTAVKNNNTNKIEISLTLDSISEKDMLDQEPVLPSAGNITFKDISINQEDIETGLTDEKTNKPMPKIEDYSTIFIKTAEGTEVPLKKMPINGEKTTYTISLSDYTSPLDSIIIKNNNTAKKLTVSQPSVYNNNASNGFEPVNPVSTASDAKIVYEGITMTRSQNDIDDIIPNVTLHIAEPTEHPATIEIKPDTETIKNSLIEFVGNYNKLIAQINIVTQNKEELISELDYLSDDEKKTATDQLGMFQSDIALTSSKQTLQNIVSNYYRTTEDSKVNLLSDIGISTNASSGYNGYSASKLRGYLEINEDTLDNALSNNLSDIKNIFGYDTDNDKLIDTGVGYLIYQNLHSYTMTAGIISMKTSALDSKISSSKTKITNLQASVDDKEQALKEKYGTMESTLNSLNSQSTTIENFTNQNSNNK